MKTITFLRHAEPDRYGALSPHGIAQASQRALYFCNNPPDLIITSNAPRAILTGRCIQDALHLTIPEIILNELSIPDVIDDLFLKKAKQALETSITEYNAQNIVVISHSGLINYFGQEFATFEILNSTLFGCAEGFQIQWENHKPFLTLLK